MFLRGILKSKKVICVILLIEFALGFLFLRNKRGNGSISSTPSSLPGKEPQWKIVSFPGCLDLLLVSAYFDRRYSPPRVAVIAGVDWECQLTLSCVLRTSTDDDPLITDVQVYLNPEGMAKITGERPPAASISAPIGAFLLECLVPETHVMYHFTSVSLMLSNASQTLPETDKTILKKLTSDDNITTMSDSIVIQYPKELTPRRQFTVCQGVLRYEYGKYEFDIHQLIEYIETSVIFGASKFVFYDLYMNPLAHRIFQQYENEAVVQVKNFRIPSLSGKLRACGQSLVLMDCYYDNRWASEYIAHQDQDERIVPMNNLTSWNEMVEFTKVYVKPNFISMNIKNVFFPRDSSDFEETFARNHEVGSIESPVKDRPMLITTISYTQKFNFDFRYGQRSKYISDPRRVLVPGFHFVQAEFNSTRLDHTALVPTNIGQLFHYRMLGKLVGDVSPERLQNETRMLTFQPMIVKKIKERLKKLADANIWV